MISQFQPLLPSRSHESKSRFEQLLNLFGN
jgi:hypothetical protein